MTIDGIRSFYKKAQVSVNPEQEIKKLRYIFSIHNEVGVTIYQRKLGEWELETDLIGGFLTAIQSFSSEIKKMSTSMRKMEYKDFEIIIERGKYAFFAIFIDGTESYWIRDKLSLFSKEFENLFEENLKIWTGELTVFEKSEKCEFLINRVFELYRL